jgi:predicted ATPase
MTTVLEAYEQKLAAGELTADPVQAAALRDLSRLADMLAGYVPGRRGLFRRRASAPMGYYFYGGPAHSQKTPRAFPCLYAGSA